MESFVGTGHFAMSCHAMPCHAMDGGNGRQGASSDAWRGRRGGWEVWRMGTDIASLFLSLILFYFISVCLTCHQSTRQASGHHVLKKSSETKAESLTFGAVGFATIS